MRQYHMLQLQVLLDRGADPNAQTTYNSTPLLLAVKHSHTEATRMLLAAGASYEYVDDHKRTLLMLAAADGQRDIMQQLLDKVCGNIAQTLPLRSKFMDDGISQPEGRTKPL